MSKFNKSGKPDDTRRTSKGKKFSGKRRGSSGSKPTGKILKDKRTDGMDERYGAETAPSMKNPNAKNDSSWYTYSADVINMAGSINYNNPIGLPFSKQISTLSDDASIKLWATDPSVMCIKWCPTPGRVGEGGHPDLSSNAPVNLQVRSLYTLMQATVTQNLPFAAADLAVHIFYMDNVYIMWGNLQRLYYILRKYDVMNRTVPNTLLKAYGLDKRVLFNSDYTLNDFQADLLLLEQEIHRIAIPSGFDVLNRHYWMCKHIFMDDNNIKPQLYMFVPEFIWAFDSEGETGGELVLNKIPYTVGDSGISNLVSWFRGYLSDFFNDRDVWAINGYILRAFNNFWLPDPLDVAGVINPVYEPEVLPQIHNCTPIGDMYGYRTSNASDYTSQVTAPNGHGRIVQNAKDSIVWQPALKYNTTNCLQGAVMDNRVMIDMPQVMPSPADNLVATRLITRASGTLANSGGTYYAAIDLYGTEIVTFIYIFDDYNDDAMATEGVQNQWGLNIFDQGGPGIGHTVYQCVRLAQVSKFTSAPLLPLVIDHNVTVDSIKLGWYDFMGTMNNFTVVDRDVLRKLHDAAALGEWLIK